MVCRYPRIRVFARALYGPRLAPVQFALQAQGDELKQVAVFAQDVTEPGSVILAGDNTCWATGTPVVLKRDEVMQQINPLSALHSPVRGVILWRGRPNGNQVSNLANSANPAPRSPWVM